VDKISLLPPRVDKISLLPPGWKKLATPHQGG